MQPQMLDTSESVAMMFLGDIAMPAGIAPRVVGVPGNTFAGVTIANLEGAVVEGDEGLLSEAVLFNDPAVLSCLRELGVQVISLANNHIFDVTASPKKTILALEQWGIATCGAGDTLAEAARPAVIQHNNTEYVFLAFGWEVIQCRAARLMAPGVNPLRPKHVLGCVAKTKRERPHCHLILLMHWNYELETCPQPMHRQLAFDAIDAGANAVIGCHSHCVQGMEIYKGAPIVYSLGNWFVPHGVFWGSSLRYPALSERQLGFEWEPKTGRMTCHWFNYVPGTHEICYESSEAAETSGIMRQLSPFAGMEQHQYIEWFARNRRKRRLLPIYKDYRHERTNRMRDSWVAARQFLVKCAFRSGLKGGAR